LPAVAGVPRTFTIHDFRSLDRPEKGHLGKTRLRRNIERADGIICLTEHGRVRLTGYYPDLDPACVAVVPHGVDHTLFYPRDPVLAMKTAGALGLDRPFLLQLGSWFPHKNLELSIRAFARSRARGHDYQLVFIGGGAGHEYRHQLEELVRREGLDDRVLWIGDVSGSDLPVLVSAAACLLQPSRYEGFALPLLEAMASGVPGVVSDSSCLPEVSGGIWPVAGQDDVDSFAEGLDRMTLDARARSAAIAAGLEYARGFTWQRTALQTATFFRQVLERRS
jgi:glycosyltransferase involved in cell wall biosynthesis